MGEVELTRGESRRIRFGAFEVDPRAGELYREGRQVTLQEQPFQILTLLLQRPGELVTRDELSQSLWPDGTFVDFDRGLNTAVNKLRSALGDSAESPTFVQTVARRGYRFIAPVEELNAPRSPAVASTKPNLVQRPRRVAWILATLAVVLVAGFAGRSLLGRPTPAAAPSNGKLMLAVLPFVNLSSDPDQEFFSDGLTEELIAHMGGGFPTRLGVIARTTVMHYKETTKSISEIAQELGVDYVLEGSVRSGEGRLRITAQLIQVSDETHLWAESYDARPENILTAQREVARKVAQSLALEMLPNDAGAAPIVDPQAYEAYLKGRYFRDMITETGFRKSIEFFEEAVTRDPNFAQAYAAMGGCYCLLSGHGLEVNEPSALMPAAKDAAQRALVLDPDLAEARGVLGMAKLKYEWDWRGAEQEFKRAIQLNPSYALAHIWYSFYLSTQGRHQDAIAHARTARELDMFSRAANVNVAMQNYEARQYDEAIEQYDKTLELFPRLWVAHLGRGLAFVQKGVRDRALEDLELAVEISEGNHAAVGALGYGYARLGDPEKARGVLAELINSSEEGYVPPTLIAAIYGALDEVDNAFVWLEKAYQMRSRSLVWLKVAHEFDPLRSDPRLDDVLLRMGLASAAGRTSP